MVPFTVGDMKAWCGKTSYQRGEVYVQEGRVTTLTHHGQGRFQATVAGGREHTVQVSVLTSGGVQAECSCPAAASYYGYCKHVAAVLITIHKLHQGKSIRSKWDVQTSYQRDQIVASSLISLFHQHQVQNQVRNQDIDDIVPLLPIRQPRVELQVLFICKVVQSFGHTSKFVIELKVGEDRLYVVQNIGEFLSCLHSRQTYEFTKHFSYDPQSHYFKSEDLEVLHVCKNLSQSEHVYDDMSGTTSTIARRSPRKGSKRQLVISPLVWQDIAMKLSHQGVQAVFEALDGQTYPFQWQKGKLPVTFILRHNQDTQEYNLTCQHFDRCHMMPLYHSVLTDEGIIALSPQQMNLAYELYQLLYHKQDETILIPTEQMEAFMSQVLPGLQRLCHCDVEHALQQRIEEHKLIAQLYLDQDVDGLHGKLEFKYGEHSFDPWQQAEHDGHERSKAIVVRDLGTEAIIKEMLLASPFILHTGELIAFQDDEIYDILFKLLPQLTSLVEVYTTPVVKRMIYQPVHPPELRIERSNDVQDWLEISFEYEALTQQERQDILLHLIEKKKYYRLPEGAFLSLESKEFQDFHSLYDKLGGCQGNIKGSVLAVPLTQIFQTDYNQDHANALIRYSDELQMMIEQLQNPDLLDIKPPLSLQQPLRDYQVKGFRFMSVLGRYQLGGILADDMGLGKTLQSIAYIVSRIEAQGQHAKKTLIVAPASLIYNWAEEFRKFAPHITVDVITGDKDGREKILLHNSHAEVWITTYHAVRLDIDLYRNVELDTLILDEAQFIKNGSSQTAQAIRKLSATCAFALTGTPIENKLEDMWSIFHIVFPSLFNSRKEFLSMSRESIGRRAAPFILRRLKKDVLHELPDRIDSIMQTELTTEQKRLYQSYLTQLQADTANDLMQGGFHAHRMKILAGITRLRQICCHPSLFIEGYEGGSSKLEQLLELVTEASESGRRILIFSQFTSMLALIAKSLEELNIDTFYLDGSTPAKERIALCQRFNEGERQVFLISLKAGGTGLNLTGADTVILYDLWWNPAVEEQAAGRAHRMGQKQVVQVIRMITKGTVEDKILALQERKRNLLDEVVGSTPDERMTATLTEEDIRSLLMI